MALPIALQLYSVRDAMEKDFRGTLEKVKAMGYDGVEFAGLFGNSAEDVKKMCEEIGLVPISAHIPYVDFVSDLDKTLSTYAEIGCKFVVIPYLHLNYCPGGEDYAEFVENAKKIGAAANEKGMTLLYHNHDFEFAKKDGKYLLDIMYEDISAELLETELDTCWVNVGGENPADYVRKYAGRAPVVHLKDFFGEKADDMYELIGEEKKAVARPNNFEFRPVGAGLQNFPEILAAVDKSNVSWVVVEQDKPSMQLSSLECVAKSIEYLKSIGY